MTIQHWSWDGPGPYRVGDRVRIAFGAGTIDATIVEDRGNLGRGGTRMYGVRYRLAEVPEEIYTERNVDDITLIARAPEPEPRPRKKKRPRE